MLKQATAPEQVLKRLEWTVIRRLDGLLQGDYRTLFYGAGLDLAELREYQFSDDVRYIDWNVTARLQTPYVRQYLEDREVTAWFLLDLSASVDFGTVNRLKRDLLTDFVAVLARLLARHGNPVGSILYTDRVASVIPPRSGKAQVLRLIGELQEQPPGKREHETNIGELLGTACNTIRRRSMVFVISDFFSLPGWEKPLGMLARRNEVLAVRLNDPREVELPDIGTLVFEDAETGEQLLVDTRDRGFRKRFTEAAAKREAMLDLAFGRAGVDCLSLSTEGDLVGEIVKFAVRRKRRKIATVKHTVK